MRDEGVSCEDIQRALRERRELRREQSAHLAECDACMDSWLTMALDAKPELAIPADFAARVTAGLPARPEKQSAVRALRPWGVISAMAVVLVVLVLCFAAPAPANSWMGLVFVMVVASEIAVLALWLGPQWMRR